MEKLLEVRGICKSYSGIKALDNVDMTINKGEVHCLAGMNGSGKSTLIKIIAGVETFDDGEIIIEGHCYKKLHPMESIQKGIQVIYQDTTVLPNLTVAENLAFNYILGAKNKPIDWKKVRSLAKESLQKIGVEIDLDAYVEQISIADKQLLAICRALMQEAKLIIMDEPTTALTQKEVDVLMGIIRELQKSGISVLFVSHKINEVLQVAQKVTILRNGKKQAVGDISDFDYNKIVFAMIGRNLYDIPFVYEEKKDIKPLLEVKHLTRKGEYNDINFALYPGEILGITGLLGSGRTELAMSLYGLLPAESGEIYVKGKPVLINSIQRALKNKIGYVPEDRLTEGLFYEQPIGRNISVTFTKKYINKYKLINKKKINTEVQQWIDNLSIKTPSADLPVKSLSGGNQQKVVLARWLATLPDILILNAPTVGVDVGSKEDIHTIVRKLANEGKGIIIITDDIPEVIKNCNRVIVIKKGEVRGEFQTNEISEDQLSELLLKN